MRTVPLWRPRVQRITQGRPSSTVPSAPFDDLVQLDLVAIGSPTGWVRRCLRVPCESSRGATVAAIVAHARNATDRSRTSRASGRVRSPGSELAGDEGVDEAGEPGDDVGVERRGGAQHRARVAACSRAVSIARGTASPAVTSSRARGSASRSILRPSRSRSSGERRERVDDRQRVDALDDVVAGRLAERLVGAGDVEHVVDDLEAHAEVEAERR